MDATHALDKTMKRRRTKRDDDHPLVTVESAILLARWAPRDAWAFYLGGSIPFVLGMLYFWSDMSRGAFARQRCAPAALGLTILFLIMKAGQSMYTARLLDVLTHRRRVWTLRRLGRLVGAQSVFQPWGLLILPLGMPALIPYVYGYGFFQHLTVLGDGEVPGLKAIRRRAAHLAQKDFFAHGLMVWLLSPWMLGLAMVVSFGAAWLLMRAGAAQPGAGTTAVWVAGMLAFLLLMWPWSPLGSALALNLAVLFLAVPELLRMLLGWDTVFRLSSVYAIANTTFLATLFGVAYLCLDPLLKAAYTIRRFKAEALRDGLDLKVALAECRETRETRP